MCLFHPGELLVILYKYTHQLKSSHFIVDFIASLTKNDYLCT